MIGTTVERAGIIRHEAKMLAMMSEATVPKIQVVVRKAYGAGLYAMGGPAFEPDCSLDLPTAQFAVTGPDAAANAVYEHLNAELTEAERRSFNSKKQDEYRLDTDIYSLPSDLVINDLIEPDQLRNNLLKRFST